MNVLSKYQHPTPNKPQHSPHRWNAPVYGTKIQRAKAPDTSKKLDKKGKKKVQSVAGTFLYYGRAVEPPILVALNDISTQQANPMENTMQEVT